MKTFEEKHTAWIDGLLPTDELVAFDRELQARGDLPGDREQLRGLGDLLRSTAPALANADFFNHQIMERIQRETAPAFTRHATGWFGLPRLAWLGGFSLAVALVLFLAIIPKKSETHSREAYIAQVISARSADPTVTATAFESLDSQGDQVAVVWLDGLDYVPQEKPNVR